jgi:hypothetical protein
MTLFPRVAKPYDLSSMYNIARSLTRVFFKEVFPKIDKNPFEESMFIYKRDRFYIFNVFYGDMDQYSEYDEIEQQDIFLAKDKERTGIIELNTSGLTNERVKEIDAVAQNFLRNHNIDFNVQHDKHIYYIITKNENEYPDMPPDLNASNANMRVLLRMLGYDRLASVGEGDIDVDDLHERLLSLKNESDFDISSYERPTRHPDQEKFTNPNYDHGKAKFYDSGLPAEIIQYYLDTLDEIILWSNKNGIKNLRLS